MNDLQIFSNEEFGEVRTIVIDNEPWFVGKDVTEILGYVNASKALADHVDDDDKLNNESLSSLGQRGGWLINESGLYSLILSSRLAEAKRFKHWVTSEVLPQIRKTGGYVAPRTYAEALRAYADEVEQRERLERERQELLPKAEFFDAVTDSKTAVSIGDAAKVLDAGIGQNKLFAWLRDRNILKGDNTPYQKYIDNGYFRVVEQKYQVNGETRISIKTLVFQKGIDYIRKQLIKEGYI